MKFEQEVVKKEVPPDAILDWTVIIEVPDIDLLHPSTVQVLDDHNKLVKVMFNLITKSDLIIGEWHNNFNSISTSFHYNSFLFEEIEAIHKETETNKSSWDSDEQVVYITHLNTICDFSRMINN